MKTYYNTVNIFNALLGLYFIAGAVFLPDSNLFFFAGIMAIIILQRVWPGTTKAQLKAFKEARKTCLRANPSLLKKSAIQNFAVPLVIALLSFFLLKTTFNQSLCVFIAASCFMAILSNLMLIPHLSEPVAEAFD